MRIEKWRYFPLRKQIILSKNASIIFGLLGNLILERCDRYQFCNQPYEVSTSLFCLPHQNQKRTVDSLPEKKYRISIASKDFSVRRYQNYKFKLICARKKKTTTNFVNFVFETSDNAALSTSWFFLMCVYGGRGGKWNFVLCPPLFWGTMYPWIPYRGDQFVIRLKCYVPCHPPAGDTRSW